MRKAAPARSCRGRTAHLRSPHLGGIEGGAAAPRHGERLPVVRGEVLGQEDDLADVVAVVGELPVDGLDDAVGLGADEDGHRQVLLAQGGQRLEETAPPFLPAGQELGAGGARGQHELGVAVAVTTRAELPLAEVDAHVARTLWPTAYAAGFV